MPANRGGRPPPRRAFAGPNSESSLEVAQFFSQRAEQCAIDKEFGLGGVVSLFQGSAQMEGGYFGKLLVTQILLFLLPEFGEGGAGDRNRGVLPCDQKDAINGVAVPCSDGRKQVNKPNLNRLG